MLFDVEAFCAKDCASELGESLRSNLMHTFSAKANIGGFTVEGWTNEPEERQDFYARLPIKVQATGTWVQTAEFFRKVSELKQIVSIENLALSVVRDKEDPGAHPILKVDFEAATYRFLSDDERSSGGSTKRGSDRKKKKKKKKK